MFNDRSFKIVAAFGVALIGILGSIAPAHAEKVYVSDTQNFWIAYTSKSECDRELGANCDVAQSCGPYTVYMTTELANRILNEMNISTRHTFGVGSLNNETCTF